MRKEKYEKQIHGILLLILVILIVNSCCTEKYCAGVDDLEYIEFYGFSQDNLDTIVIKRYDKDSNFESVLDSLFTVTEHFTSFNDFEMVHFTVNFNIDYDYKIDLISTRQSFTLTDFVEEKAKCNTGFLCFDYYNALSSYRVNGETYSFGSLRINK